MRETAAEEKYGKLREQILTYLDDAYEVSDEELLEMIRSTAMQDADSRMCSMSEREQMELELFHSFRGLDILQDLLDDPEVTEILVNGPKHIFYEKHGSLYPWEKTFISEERLNTMIQNIVGRANRSVNASEPIVDTRLPDGSRVNVVLAPVSVTGPCLSIRKFPKQPLSMENLVSMGALSEEIADSLKTMVKSGYNIFVSGGTGSGKTTFLNALSRFIPQDQRVITIEDSAELQMRSVQNLVRLETRQGNNNGAHEISIRDLIRTSLRMRPDRIIVGEVRGAEALDMLQAINTGHNGSMSTGHANSIPDMLSRLETMVLMGMDLPLAAIRGQIAHGLDLFVHLGRLRDHSRKVLDIREVCGLKEGGIVLNALFTFHETEEKDGIIKGTWEKTGTLQNTEKLKNQGLIL
ncbi:MAG: CpaF family protein [Eubacterium sp.]|nr:CpaF family protein [Eubacterium sp.]